MDFERYSDNAKKAFNDLKSYIDESTIFDEFAEYVGTEDIIKFCMMLENYDKLPDDAIPMDVYNGLPKKFSYKTLLNSINKYFSESELAGFVEYLICMYEI